MGDTLPGLLRRPEAALFVLALGGSAYFYQAGSWNTNTRFDLARSLVEQRSLAIDAYAANTGDTAKKDDHLYSDKAPGISVLAALAYVPAYALTRDASDPRFLANAHYACTVFAVSLPSAIGVVAVFHLLS